MKPIVLIIEDDSTLNKIFSIALRDDFEIISYTAGEDAVLYLKDNAPNLVVLDLHLSGISGEDVLGVIHSQEHLSKTKVILTTAAERNAELLRDQVDIVLLKPVSPKQLKDLALRLTKSPTGE